MRGRCTIAKANPPIKYRLCGEKKPVRRCPSCATAVPPDHEFCGKCGTPVDGDRSAATETVYQPRSSTPSSSHMDEGRFPDRKSTRLNSSHLGISYAVFC